MSETRATRIGVISNPRSRQNLRDMPKLRALMEAHPHVLHRELHSRHDNDTAVRDLAAAGVDLVVISGGDGTVQGVLSDIVNSGLFPELPKIAVLPAGMTNLIAADVGMRGVREKSLARLIDAVEAGRDLLIARRAMITMQHCAGRPPAHGFFVGTAAFHRGTMLAREQVHRLGVQKSLAAGLALFWFLLRALFGRKGASPLYRGEAMTVCVDGKTLPEAEQFVVLGTTLSRLILGLMPFWGDGPEGLRYTSIGFPPRRFGRALLPLLRGRPRAWMGDAGYHSGRAHEMSLVTDCPMIMDGEVFPVSRDAPVVLRADREVAFVRL